MLKNYLKIAIKVFLRRKFFTFISLFAISFTLVVLMVATAFFDHIFGIMPPEVNLDRTLGIYFASMWGPRASRSGDAGYRLLDHYGRNLPRVEKYSILSEPGFGYSFIKGEKVKSFLKRTDGEYWQILKFQFLEGGPFTVEDEKNANFVAVINEATRTRLFGNAKAVGKTIEVDGQRFRVVGVVSNVPIFRIVPFSDIWVPISTAKTDSYRSELVGGFMAIVLARSRNDFQMIKDEFRSRMGHVEMTDPTTFSQVFSSTDTFFEAVSRMFFSGRRDEESHAGRLLASILIAAILFMLLPTVNLININISRIMERASEIGVRKAFGASSWTLVGQFIVENVLLTLLGAAIGFVLAIGVLQAISQSGLIPYAEFHINYRIFAYGVLVAVFFGLFSGVYPAWRMSRLNPVEALKGASR
ncbi:MAG TPA: FtsX-like permease family protein [Acidobacteriota bacterium]|jgi:putative ABC transport system permease protein